MASKANVFTADLTSLIDELVTLHHFQFFISGQLKECTDRVQKSLQHFVEKGWKKEEFAMGSCMTIFDVFKKRNGELLRIAATKGRITAGEDIIRIADETERRFNSWLAVALHERLEEFLKATYGKMLYQLRNEVTIREKQKFHRTKTGIAKREGTPVYFNEYARHACRRDCIPALNFLGEQLDVKSFAVARFWNMPFEELIVVLGHTRHGIVHAQGQISEKVLRSLNKTQVAFLKQWWHESLYEFEQRLLPEWKLVEKCYEVALSYARGIYVLLSKRFGMIEESGYFR